MLDWKGVREEAAPYRGGHALFRQLFHRTRLGEHRRKARFVRRRADRALVRMTAAARLVMWDLGFDLTAGEVVEQKVQAGQPTTPRPDDQDQGGGNQAAGQGRPHTWNVPQAGVAVQIRAAIGDAEWALPPAG